MLDNSFDIYPLTMPIDIYLNCNCSKKIWQSSKFKFFVVTPYIVNREFSNLNNLTKSNGFLISHLYSVLNT